MSLYIHISVCTDPDETVNAIHMLNPALHALCKETPSPQTIESLCVINLLSPMAQSHIYKHM